MTNFEKITASPETLGKFLAELPVATGPWDEQFHRQFCNGCKQTCNHCQHKDVRNNPTWWLTKAEEEGQAVRRAAWRNGRTKLEPGVIVALENPMRVHIRVAKSESPLGEMMTGENVGTRLETAWQTVEEVKKVHPDAEISIEVEV